jgi:hypothetical protein
MGDGFVVAHPDSEIGTDSVIGRLSLLSSVDGAADIDKQKRDSA